MKEKYQALYRVLRPQTFSDMVGQTVIRKTLKNQVRTGRIGHAYLFCGSRGTGKTSAAKIFSRAINCLNPQDGDPCCECASCKSILSDTSLDVIEIDAASNSSVENIRQLIEQVAFPPQSEKYKVYIIDEVHMLSSSAFNALLKTLEEPPEYVVFILATTDPQKMPVTILSRCQRFDFSRLNMDDLLSRLKFALSQEEAEADDNALYLIAQAADGGMRDALSILDTCLGMTNHVTVEDVRNVLGSADGDLLRRTTDAVASFDGASALRCVNEGILKGMDAISFTADLCRHFRTLLTAYLCGADAEMLKTTADEATILYESSQRFTLPHLQRSLMTFMKAEGDMRYSVSQRGVLEVALLKACDNVQEHDLSALEEKISELQNRLEILQASGFQPIAYHDPIPQTSEKNETKEIKLPEIQSKTGNEIWNTMIRNLKTNPSLFNLINQGIRFGGCQNGEYAMVLPKGNSVALQILEHHVESLKNELVKAGADSPQIRFIRENSEEEKLLKQHILSNEQELIDVFGRDVIDIDET